MASSTDSGRTYGGGVVRRVGGSYVRDDLGDGDGMRAGCGGGESRGGRGGIRDG